MSQRFQAILHHCSLRFRPPPARTRAHSRFLQCTIHATHLGARRPSAKQVAVASHHGKSARRQGNPFKRTPRITTRGRSGCWDSRPARSRSATTKWRTRLMESALASPAPRRPTNPSYDEIRRRPIAARDKSREHCGSRQGGGPSRCLPPNVAIFSNTDKWRQRCQKPRLERLAGPRRRSIF